jgi:hypothetical protein
MSLRLLMPDLGGDGHNALNERSRRTRHEVTHGTTTIRPAVCLDHVADPLLTPLAARTMARLGVVIGRVRRVDAVVADAIG